MKVKGSILSRKDFEGMRFDPFLPQEKKVSPTRHYPQLKSIDNIEFIKPYQIEFILALYSQDTPMFRVTDYTERKQLAASMATENEDQQKQLTDPDRNLSYTIDKYLRMQNNKLVSTIISNEEYFYELQSLMLNELAIENEKDLVTAIEKKGKVLGQMDDISARLEGYYFKLYGDHDKIRDMVYEQQLYNPESVAKTLTEIDV